MRPVGLGTIAAGMKERTGDELLALPVRLHGIQLGRPIDLLLDRDARRAVGLDVFCGDEERAGRRQPVMQIGAVEQSDIDEQVDDVARSPHEAELRQLLPVAPPTQGSFDADAQSRGDGCVPVVHAAGETSC